MALRRFMAVHVVSTSECGQATPLPDGGAILGPTRSDTIPRVRRALSPFVVVLVLAVLPPLLAEEAPPFARLVLHSPPGDWVGSGQNHDITYTPANSYWFFANVLAGNTAVLPDSFLRFNLGLQVSGFTTPWASLDFSTNRLGIPMAPGSYVDAERASFASSGHPGLDVGFDHHGCNELSGSFRVYGVVLSGTDIDYFSVAFEQRCERTNPPLLGWFVYYSTGVTPFADDPIVPGTTVVRGLHIEELRQRVNGLRSACGRADFPFTDGDSTLIGMPIRAVHVSELRSALDDAADGCSRPHLPYGELVLTDGTIRADHIADLRGRVIMLERAIQP